jgi:outer membrane protein assembly factor BamB
MKIDTHQGEIEIINEPTYTFGSADNVRMYDVEVCLSREGHISSTHGMLLNGGPKVVIGAAGGASGIHPHTAVAINDRVYVAVGDSVVCLALNSMRVIWSIQVDPATCFGVYYECERSALFSHGELEIARFTEDGKIIWSTSGADIFSERFNLEADAVSATDFNGSVYSFDYETGRRLV